ncbi:hypothetical protein GE061_002465 [Apolygus lucorum]|uniref:Uncharacterized protein n=1 Tax=Apolygus lucorum TaxID=248454 RepID=A0A8S9X975_APOLU|nr:hypothetical protein GE061_002465 [Apolygus lucorum]
MQKQGRGFLSCGWRGSEPLNAEARKRVSQLRLERQRTLECRSKEEGFSAAAGDPANPWTQKQGRGFLSCGWRPSESLNAEARMRVSQLRLETQRILGHRSKEEGFSAAAGEAANP